jgi:hypothetical protein
MLACDAKEPPMFSKTKDPTSAPPRPTTGAPSNSRSILAADLKITGDVRSTGSVELLGEVDGTISAHTTAKPGRLSVAEKLTLCPPPVTGPKLANSPANVPRVVKTAPIGPIPSEP